MSDYTSQFAGAEIDARLAKVPQLETALAGKQATLVPGINIKNINNESILGVGNIAIPEGERGPQGIPGITSVVVTVDNGTGTPYADTSVSGGVLTIAFHNLKGVQGNTGSSVETPYTLVNNFTDGGLEAGLAAEAGKYLYTLLFGGSAETEEPLDLTSYQEYNARITGSPLKWETNSGSGSKCALINSDGFAKIRVTMSGGNGNITFLKNANIVNGQTPSFSDSLDQVLLFQQADGTTETYDIPADAHYIYILTANTSGTDVRGRYAITAIFPETNYGAIPQLNARMTALDGARTIKPEMEIGAITNAGKDNVSSFYGTGYWRTSRFIKMRDLATITAKVTTSGNNIRFAYYDEDFDLVSTSDVTAAPTVTDTPPSGAVYLRVGVDSARPTTSAFDIPKPELSLTGRFAEKWDVPMNRPSSGSLSILVPVWVSNPGTDVSETANLQDLQSLLSDTGVLALPETYDPNGTPARLIIYCHGAGVNYAIGTGTFPTTDLLPEYWLAEGYAVMDVEGNPYNDVDEHFFMPAARQSYIAAYEFVTRKYNIKKDGILLGGRSMGGGMVFDLLLSRIPVIAACPVVPAINEIWCWEYMNASRKQFVAQKMGFTGTAPTWTSNSPMTSAEWEYLQANFDKFIKYSPFFALMPDTPSKTEIFSVGNVGASTDNADEAALYATRRFKTKAPVKMFAVHDDPTVNNSRNCDLVHRMMLNAAQIVEMRYFATGGHHFELTSPYLLASYTTQYGETLTNVPVVYVEMLAFWRRYEQGL